MNDSNQNILVVTSVGSHSDAENITDRLLEMRLAACVQIDPKVISHYRWQGEVKKETECRMTIKSTESRWIELKQHLEMLHPYDVPEIIKVSVEDCVTDYQHWVHSETKH